MSLADIVNVSFTLSNPGVTAAGFGIPLIVSHTAAWAERTRTYSSLTAVGADFGAATPEYLAAQKMFAQTTGLQKLMIGRAANKPTQQYDVGTNSQVANAVYKLRVAADNGSSVFTSQECDYTATAAASWAAGTAYTQGQLVVNDTPAKYYICITSGTSAGSGGPTGASADITDNTVHWMYAGASATVGTTTNDAIVYGLKLLVDELTAPVMPVATSLQGAVGAKTFRMTANAAGTYFAVEVLDMAFLSVAQNHADPGIAADLAAIKLASSAWYGLVTLYNSSLLVQAAAAWVEANTKLYIVASSDSAIATVAYVAAGADVFNKLRDAAYARTGPAFHTAPDDFFDAAEIARWFPINPGGDNWIYKTLPGVTIKVYTDTMITNITAKYANYYADFAGVNAVQGSGLVSAHEYIDVIRFRDWYVARLQERVANLLLDAEKVPFTDAGIALMETQVKAQNTEGVRAGGIAPNSPDTPITVTAPTVADISTADKQARWLKGVASGWTLAGAINKLSVNVEASP
jgi:hypothetical protein